jgi:hypothetical protein
MNKTAMRTKHLSNAGIKRHFQYGHVDDECQRDADTYGIQPVGNQ